MSKNLMPNEASVYLDSLVDLAHTLCRFQIHTCYNVTVPGSWRIDERVLDEDHLLYVRSGCVTYRIEGRPFELVSGQLLFLSKGVVHSAFRNPEVPLSIIPVRFKLDLNGADNSLSSASSPSHFSYQPRNSHKFLVLFEAVYRYYQLPASPKRDILCHASLCQTLTELSLELERKESGKPDHPALQQMKTYMDSHPAERFSTNELSLRYGLTAKYGSRLFHQAFGLTLKAYQLQTRIEYARYLLQHTGQSVKEISLHLGYPDPFAFSKQYKAITGLAPSEARRDLS